MSQLSRSDQLISCVIPVYNEQAVIASFIEALDVTLNQLGYRYEIIIIDDGSLDNTQKIVTSYRQNHHLRYYRFSRNFGKEKALSAGIDLARGDAVILLDADFQHPLELLSAFIERWQSGVDMVYAVRQSRQDESFLKRWSAKVFYHLTAKINRVTIPPNAGDFRLLDRKIVNALRALPERNRFMKGLYSWVGFHQEGIPFEVQPRAAGISRWNFYALVDLAITGITSFTSFPLRMIALGGMSIATLALLYAFWIVLTTLCFGATTPGWATIVTAISFFSGLQLFAIGAVGEYIGRIFDEVKARPQYLIDEDASFDNP